MEINIIDTALGTAIKAAKQAGKISLKYFNKTLKISKKGSKNFVTHVDVECEKAILKIIKKEFSEHSICAEECGIHDKDSEYRWFIDPIDGTHNYMRNIPLYGVSIALEHKKEIILGVIYLPIFDDLYVAVKGKGAFCNSKKIKVSNITNLEDAHVSFSSNIHKYTKQRMALLKSLGTMILSSHMTGAAIISLCYVASGRFDAQADFSNHYDHAAGFLLVEEAGGKITDLKGNKVDHYHKGSIISNGKLHDKIIKAIK